MEGMKKKAITGGVLLVAVLFSYGFSSLLFSPALKSHQQMRAEKEQLLSKSLELSLQKEAYDSAWEKQKALLFPSVKPEVVLNQWVRELLGYAQSRGLVFEKLEPQRIKKSGKKKKIEIFLHFRGDIRKLTRFLYHLHEKDPLAKVESLSMQQEEDSKSFVYRVTLTKVLL